MLKQDEGTAVQTFENTLIWSSHDRNQMNSHQPVFNMKENFAFSIAHDSPAAKQNLLFQTLSSNVG